MRKPGKCIVPITNTLLWEFWVVEVQGTLDVGRSLFYSYPWQANQPPRPTAKQDGVPPKILFARLGCPLPLQYGELLNVDELCACEHETTRILGNTLKAKYPKMSVARWDESNSIRGFWTNFFGHDQFLDMEPKKWDIPDLIVSSGEMRNYSELGAETLSIGEQLERIGKMCDIPVLFPWAT